MADKTSAGGDESDGAVNPKTSKVNGMGRLLCGKMFPAKKNVTVCRNYLRPVIQHGNEVCCL